MHRLWLTLAFCCATLAAEPAAAQTGDLPAQAPDAETANTPGEFARLAIMAHQFQMRAGALVAEKAQDEEVAEFARATAARHEELQSGLIRNALLEGLSRSEMPRILDAFDRDRIQQLQDAPPDEVGDLYIEMQLKALTDTSTYFYNYGRKGGRLAEFAENALPDIADQLDRAKALAG